MSGLLLDSLEAFWAVVEQLEKGLPVAEAEWEALFRTSGYQALAQEFQPPALRRRFAVAFGLGREDEAKAMAAQDWLAAHYLWVKAERERIQAFTARLEPQRLLAEAVAYCAPWLPAGVPGAGSLTQQAAAGGAPPVALAVFDADARGYETVVVDAGLAYRLGAERLALLLGHEFHHWYRARVGLRLPAGDLGWVLDQIQAEGIAFLTEMDRLLTQMAALPGSAAQGARQLREALPMAGHPIGYYMAGRILSAGLREAMTDSWAEPVQFFRLYGRACGLLSVPCELSDGALAYLEGV